MPRTSHLDDQPQLPHLIATINEKFSDPGIETDFSINITAQFYNSTTRISPDPTTKPIRQPVDGLVSGQGRIIATGTHEIITRLQRRCEWALTQTSETLIEWYTTKLATAALVNNIQTEPLPEKDDLWQLTANFTTDGPITIYADMIDSRDHIADHRRFETLVSPNHHKQSLGK